MWSFVLQQRMTIMEFIRLTAHSLLLLFLSTPLLLNAATESGIIFADTVSSDNDTLVLSNTGTRTFWFIPIYAAALYLPDKNTNAKDIIESNTRKQIVMHFIYRKVSKKRLLKNLDKGFSDNLNKASLVDLQPKINQLKSLFRTVVKGDRIILDYSPAIGTRLFLNNELQGTIKGKAFHQATFRVWLGDKPADVTLKKQLLNQN